MRALFVYPTLWAVLAVTAAAQTAPTPPLPVIPVWPGTPPLAQGSDPGKDIPTLTVYAPPAGKATGAAIVVLPGGAYSHLSDREGKPTSQWLAQNGITAFLLKYRLGPKYHHPAELMDAQRAIRDVRANAAQWNVDPHRVGILGYSAGGHLASTAATHFTAGDPQAADPVERVSSRPDLQILIYPVITLSDEPNVHHGSRLALLGPNPSKDLEVYLSSDQQVTADTPPCFLVHSTADHGVPVANSDLYAAALMKDNVPLVYLRANYGGHGFGLTDAWAPQCIAWLRTQKF